MTHPHFAGHLTGHDLETPDTVWDRFGILIAHADPAAATAVMTMPIAAMTNPFTGAPTLGPLAILVDAAAGIVNHFRRRPDRWTVSSELSLELSPDAEVDDADPNLVVTATARALGPIGATALGVCTLTCGDAVVGAGAVRSCFISADRVLTDCPEDGLVRSGETTLAELMGVHIGPVGPCRRVLMQGVDPALHNGIGVMHGGVAGAGLELAASAVINTGGAALRTASLRVNFLRPFHAGDRSRYEATALRIGRTTAVADAQAVGRDGRAAIVARVTAYR